MEDQWNDMPDDDEEEAGSPLWMTTFADLMTLLMCFFVLLVAFSEMDIQRYRMIAGSMKEAFGVQREVRAFEAPKGTSHIAEEFSPGNPEFTPIHTVRQMTDDTQDSELECYRKQSPEEMREDIQESVAMLEEILADELNVGLVEVEGRDDRVVIRISEKGLFRTGKASLKSSFSETLDRIGEVLNGVPGVIAVGGHTDERPISTKRYRSNWDLSSARAVSVVHRLSENGLDTDRMVAQGYAHSRPLVPNISDENRAMNRRVEISIIQSTAMN